MNKFNYLKKVINGENAEGDDSLVSIAGPSLLQWMKDAQKGEAEGDISVSEEFLCALLEDINHPEPDVFFNFLVQLKLDEVESVDEFFTAYRDEWYRCDAEWHDEQRDLDNLRGRL